LTMLMAVADEVKNMDKARRTVLVAATSSQWSDVAGLAIGFIPKQMAAGLLQSSESTPAQPAEEGTS